MNIIIYGGETSLQVKTNFIDKALKDAPGGLSIFLTGIASNGVQLTAVGYWYSVKTTVLFVVTESACTAKTYMMKHTDSYSNLCLLEVEHLSAISGLFRDSNTIDRHNQSRQYDLDLKIIGYKRLIPQSYLFHD